MAPHQSEKGKSSSEGQLSSSERASRVEELLEICHRLNQPLTAISNYAQAGAQLVGSEQVDMMRLQELFEKIAVQAARTFVISQDLSKAVMGGEGG